MNAAIQNRNEMSQNDIARRALLTAVFAVLFLTIFIIMLAGMHDFPFRPPFHGEISSEVLAAELAADPIELCGVIGTTRPASAVQESCANRQTENDQHNASKAIALLSRNTKEDLFVIPCYALFVFCFAYLAVASCAERDRILAWIVGVLIGAAAIFDYLEDFGIFASLKAEALNPSVIARTRAVSLTKWSLLGLSLLLVAVILFRASDVIYGRILRNILGAIALTAGTLMLIATRLPSLMVVANSLFGLLFLVSAPYLLYFYWQHRVSLRAANRVNPQEHFSLATPEFADEGSGYVSKAPPHLLPYGIIFEEYLARRPEALKSAACEELLNKRDTKAPGDEPNIMCSPIAGAKATEWKAALRNMVAEVNKAYETLDQNRREKQAPVRIDELLSKCKEADRPLKRILHRMNGSALCLSGGGIRSASFCLGVLEGLARFSLGSLNSEQKSSAKAGEQEGLLHNLDYLSTVSGGGYIGSWLSAWTYRRWKEAYSVEEKTWCKARDNFDVVRMKHEKNDDRDQAPDYKEAKTAEEVAREALRTAQRVALKDCYGAVIKGLAGKLPESSGDPAPRPVRHLREYTSYLAPSLGLSLDSWTLIAIYFRNLLINWLMLVPLIVAVVTIPQVTYHLSKDFKDWLANHPDCIWAGLLLAVALFVFAAWFAGHNLPSRRNRPQETAKEAKSEGPGAIEIVCIFVVPVMLANWLLAELWWSVDCNWSSRTWQVSEYLVPIMSWLGLFLLSLLLFGSYRRRIRRSTHATLARGGSATWRFFLMQLAVFAGAAAAMGLTLGLVKGVFPSLSLVRTVVLGHVAGRSISFNADDRVFMIFAVPLVALIPLLIISLFSALVSAYEMEEDREWWARAGAIQLSVIAAWILFHAISLYGAEASIAIWTTLTGVGLGALGSGLGWSGQTSAGPRPVKAAQKNALGSFLDKHDLLLPMICGAALLLLTLGVAAGESKLAIALWGAKLTRAHLVILLTSLVVALIVNRAISINTFSLNGLYRMRLMRAFLAASYSQRTPDKFTGFDPEDTPEEIHLANTAGAPLHVINTTLNLVGTKDTAWRQRKAEPFSFTPLHSGSWRLGYVPTKYYAGASGPTLATAMTISGAAFNPNMGYHSSPLVTLLMTFFNVRLGWWLPNPKRETGANMFRSLSAQGEDFLRRTDPWLALGPLVREALGMTDDTYRWIELTDGGHFENLALYEMVMRRCKKIIVVDAGADPKCQFEDLGNALRKIEIDLGIPIRFSNLEMHAGAQPENRYCAVAKIDYECVDDEAGLSEKEREALAGKLIYIKAAITGKEPPDIKQYALTHDDFPHETTANQFFNEAQFESYRHLGSHEVETIAKEGQRRSPTMEGIACLLWGRALNVKTDFESFERTASLYSAAARK